MTNSTGLMQRYMIALLASAFVMAAVPQKERSVYETEILSSRTTLDQERIVRKAVSVGRLG